MRAQFLSQRLYERSLWCTLAALMLTSPLTGRAQLITSVTDANADAVPCNATQTSQRENDMGGAIVPFAEGVFAYTDRNHKYMSPRFDPDTGALSTTGSWVGIMPPYLVGTDTEYVSTRNDHKDNVGFQITVTLGTQDVTAYLLIDNRIGDATSADPPTLAGVMDWVAGDGWTQVSTGLSPDGPNGPQPDFIAIDEGATMPLCDTPVVGQPDFLQRATLTNGLGSLNGFMSIYKKEFAAGAQIILGDCVYGNDMHGLVVVPRPRVTPPTCHLMVTPSGLNAQGYPGTAPASSTIGLKSLPGNAGAITYTATKMITPDTPGPVDWMSLSKTSGVIDPDGNDSIELSFAIPAELTTDQTAYVRITNSCGETTLVEVNLTVHSYANLIATTTCTGTDGRWGNGPPDRIQRENDYGYTGFPGAIVPWNLGVPLYLDRNHSYASAKCNTAGTLVFGTTAGSFIGAPPYLIGGEYVATLNGNRDNASFVATVTLNPTVTEGVWAYLLIDNRVGDSINTNPPTLGSGGTGLMYWVADDGWTQMYTGISPNGQADYVGIDEGATPANWDDRRTNKTNLDGNPNQACTVYRKSFMPAEGESVITLREQNNGGLNMYGLVVVRKAPCKFVVTPKIEVAGVQGYTDARRAVLTLSNVGDDQVTTAYTVTELDANKNSLDVPWLSLDKTSGAAAVGVPDEINLTLPLTGLVAGTYQAYLRVAVTCDPLDPSKNKVHDVPVTLTLTTGAAEIIDSVTDEDSDPPVASGISSQRENDWGYNGVSGPVAYFGEDAFCFTDRTHQYNGAAFDATTGALSTTGTNIIGLPAYLVGGEYASTRNDNKNNYPGSSGQPQNFRLHVTVFPPVSAYLLIDNRAGDGTNTNPPTLGRGGTGAMPWILDEGWVRLNTGLSPNDQPDFGGYDEGSGIGDFDARQAGTGTTGAGNGLNSFFSIYKKNFPAGATITTKEASSDIGDMYGLVVTARPPCGLSFPNVVSSSSVLQGAATPTEIPLLVMNDGTGGTPSPYAVIETDAEGAPVDYPWLSIAQPNASIAAGATETVAIQLKVDGPEFPDGHLPLGIYVGYLKLTGDCASTALHKVTIEVEPPDTRLPQRLAPNGWYVETVGSMTWDQARVHYGLNYQNNLPVFHNAVGDWKKPTDRYMGAVIGSRADMWLPGTDANGVSALDNVNLGSLLGTAEGVFKWLDGTEVPMGDITLGGLWNTGEPNDYYLGVPGEDAMELYAAGLWNDNDAGASLGQGSVLEPYYLLYEGVTLPSQGKVEILYRVGTTANLDEAIALLKNPPSAGDAEGKYYAVSFGDPGTGGNGSGNGGAWRDWPKVPWPTDAPTVENVDDNDFVTRTVGALVVTEAGTYTFAIPHDDDVMITIGTQQEIGGAIDQLAEPWAVQQRFTGSTPAPNAAYVLVTFPTPGTYPLELIHREGTGSSFLQLFTAKGDVNATYLKPYHQLFRLVGDVLGGGIGLADPCGRVFADRDSDGDVDQDDFARFQTCFTVNGQGIAAVECACLDRDGDNDVDVSDFAAFTKCFTGPAVPWSAELTPDCVPQLP